MKKLYLIGGTMGVGKTTVSKNLKIKLDNSVFLDGDSCWDAHPFTVTDETKKMVLENITFLLNQFIHCSAYENIIFCWVMHEQSIIDAILSKLDLTDVSVKPISLICGENTLVNRLSGGIRNGIRQSDIISRSIARIPLYEKVSTVKVKTDGKSPEEIASEIALL